MCNICEIVPQKYVTSYPITTKDTKTCYGTCHLRNRIDSFSYDHTPLHYMQMKRKLVKQVSITPKP